MQTTRPVASAQLARDEDYSSHMLGLIRVWKSYLLHFLNVSESNQLQVLFQNCRAQSPEVRLIVVLSVHEITDIGILRMIIDLGFDRNVAA